MTKIGEAARGALVQRLAASVFILAIGCLGLVPRQAHAVPSYASQTGLPCSTCHTIAFGPALTPYGQQFKLNGYTWGHAADNMPKVAAMVVSSFTNTQAGQDGGAAPHFASNDNLAVDQTSLFYGGRIAGPVGAFVQVTYDGIAQRLGWDNLDVRAAKSFTASGMPVVAGVTFNNNPTVQDLWNSTPAWSFPYEASGLAPSPTAAPLIEGALAQTVGGVTAYAMVDRWVYVEGGAYRNLPHRLQSQLGVGPDGEDTVKGFAPYWRAAVQHGFGPLYASVGTFIMSASMRPGGDDTYGTNRYTDYGFDATYQYALNPKNAFNGNLTYIHENQRLGANYQLGASANSFDTLSTARLNLAYVWNQAISFTVSGFEIRGTQDAGLYAPDPVGGSNSGSPNSKGEIYQLEYVPFGKAKSWLRPWVNVRLGLQYTDYNQFNGGASNYDGSSRSASDNNTLFAFLWLAI